MVLRVEFNAGRATLRNRYVKTDGYVKEKEAGKVLYRGVFGTTPKSWWLQGAFNMTYKNVANTALLHLPTQTKILALWEGGLPHALDAFSLDTLGVETMDG